MKTINDAIGCIAEDLQEGGTEFLDSSFAELFEAILNDKDNKETHLELGKTLMEEIENYGNDEYQEGLKTGLKIIWNLYKTIDHKETFEKLAKAHLNVNCVKED